MQMTFRWYGDGNDDITPEMIRQIPGVGGLVWALHDKQPGEIWTVEEIEKVRARIEGAGFHMDVVESVNVHDDIKIGLPTRDQYIENYKTTLKNLAKFGVKVVTYNFMPIFDWTRTDLFHPLEDGSNALYYEKSKIQDDYKEMAEYILENLHGKTFPGWEPERLAEIRGITTRKAMDISTQLEEKKDMRDVMIFLQGYGISPTLSTKIFNNYGTRVYDIIKTNPYQLADDVTGIGFKTADEIARRAGVEVNASVRIKSGMCYALTEASLSGHTYLPKEKMVETTINLLGLRDQYLNADGTYNMELLDNCFTELVLEKKLILKEIDDNQAVFLSTFYYTELNIARMLLELNISTPEDDYILGVKMDTVEDMSGIHLDDLQRQAVVATQNNGVSIITGGPGTGKTTTINAIIQLFESDGLEVSLAAPTGRAAKRMTEATGHEAKTIHRMLEISGGQSDDPELDAKFGRNEQNPLETDVVIVDEMSMVDTFLMHAFLKAVTVGTRLVFVGDVNQLASVGPGNVLKDIIESECFKVVRLTKVFRQAGESGIVTNAHKINEGKEVKLDNSFGDFLYIERENAQMALNATIGLIKTKLPAYVGANEMDIQVLTPMRNGILGVNSLNPGLQMYMNPPDKNKR